MWLGVSQTKHATFTYDSTNQHEIQHLHETFRANVFPVKVINSILKDTQHSQPQPQQTIRRYDYNNGITNIVHEHGHHIHWNQAKVVATEQY